jgi:hypothetical protein
LASQRVVKIKNHKHAVVRSPNASFKRAVQSTNGALIAHIEGLNIDPKSPIINILSSPPTLGMVFETPTIDDAIFSLPSPSPSASSLSSSSSSSNTSLECLTPPLHADFDLNVSMSAFAVLDGVEAHYARFMGLYFNSTHSWLTIVRKQRFIKRVAASKHKAEAEVAILLLAMRLVAEPFDFTKTQGDASRDTLYQAAKNLHAIIQASKGPSLELIQAGVLIALFEHNSAIADAAYDTLVNCFRMSQYLGLDMIHSGTKSKNSYVSAIEEERRRTYWGIVALDRYALHLHVIPWY